MPEFSFPISNFKSKLPASKCGYAIIDLANAINGRTPDQIITSCTRIFVQCSFLDLIPIIVGKMANEARFRRELAGVSIPDDILYFFLHGSNKTCPDDAFIIQLYSLLTTNGMHCVIFSNDKYRRRETWSYAKTMISWNDQPTRPRHISDDTTWVCKLNRSLITKTDIPDSDKIDVPRPESVKVDVSCSE